MQIPVWCPRGKGAEEIDSGLIVFCVLAVFIFVAIWSSERGRGIMVTKTERKLDRDYLRRLLRTNKRAR